MLALSQGGCKRYTLLSVHDLDTHTHAHLACNRDALVVAMTGQRSSVLNTWSVLRPVTPWSQVTNSCMRSGLTLRVLGALRTSRLI